MIEKFFALFGTVGGYIIIGSVIVLIVAIIVFNPCGERVPLVNSWITFHLNGDT